MSTATLTRPRRIPDRVRVAREYRLYLETEYTRAEAATRGVLVNAAGERRGISPRTTWFAGRRGTLAYASEELIDHFATEGQPMTTAEYRMHVTPTEDDYADDYAADHVTDAAGIVHVVDYREWADVAYTVCEVWCDPAVSGAVVGGCPVCRPSDVESVAAPDDALAAAQDVETEVEVEVPDPDTSAVLALVRDDVSSAVDTVRTEVAGGRWRAGFLASARVEHVLTHGLFERLARLAVARPDLYRAVVTAYAATPDSLVAVLTARAVTMLDSGEGSTGEHARGDTSTVVRPADAGHGATGAVAVEDATGVQGTGLPAPVGGGVVVGPVDRELTGCDRCGRDHRKGTVAVITGDGGRRYGLACAAVLLGVGVDVVRGMSRAGGLISTHARK